MKEEYFKKWEEELPEKAREENLARMNQIAEQVAKKRIQFLCGAGMSKASGLPLAEDLNALMIGVMLEGKRPKRPFPGNLTNLAKFYPIESVAEAYLHKIDEARLGDLLSEELKQSAKGKHLGHDALEYLASQGYINRVYTTNFDTLIEEEGFGEKAIAITDKKIDLLYRAYEKGQIPDQIDLVWKEARDLADETELGDEVDLIEALAEQYEVEIKV